MKTNFFIEGDELDEDELDEGLPAPGSYPGNISHSEDSKPQEASSSELFIKNQLKEMANDKQAALSFLSDQFQKTTEPEAKKLLFDTLKGFKQSWSLEHDFINLEMEITSIISDVIKVESLKDHLTTTYTEIMPKFLYEGEAMMLVGATNSGKTTALINLVYALSTGSMWLGEFFMPKQKVAFVNTEEKSGMLARKLVELEADGPKIDWDMIHYIDRSQSPIDPGTLNSFMRNLVRVLKNEKCKIVVFDSIYRFINGDINSAEIGTKFVNAIGILTAAGISVVFSTHTSKKVDGTGDLSQAAIGSFVFSAFVKAQIFFGKVLDMEGLLPGQRPIFYQVTKDKTGVSNVRHYKMLEHPHFKKDTGGRIEAHGKQSDPATRKEADDQAKANTFIKAFEAVTSETGKNYALVKDIKTKVDASNDTLKKYAELADYEYGNHPELSGNVKAFFKA